MPDDTSPAARAVLFDALRRMTPRQRWARLGGIQRTARALHAAGYRHFHPGASEADARRDWRRARLSGAAAVGDADDTMTPDDLAVLRRVLDVLADLGIETALGGSIASSIYGAMRFTQDADVTVLPFPGRETALATALESEFYVSVAALQAANRDRTTCNVIHPATGFKVDLFVRRDRPFDIAAFDRARPVALGDAGLRPIRVYVPEDVVLFKLQWFRQGNEVSDRQWQDILGVLRARGGELDLEHLRRWATVLGVDDLLERALAEAGT